METMKQGYPYNSQSPLSSGLVVLPEVQSPTIKKQNPKASFLAALWLSSCTIPAGHILFFFLFAFITE